MEFQVGHGFNECGEALADYPAVLRVFGTREDPCGLPVKTQFSGKSEAPSLPSCAFHLEKHAGVTASASQRFAARWKGW